MRRRSVLTGKILAGPQHRKSMKTLLEQKVPLERLELVKTVQWDPGWCNRRGVDRSETEGSSSFC